MTGIVTKLLLSNSISQYINTLHQNPSILVVEKESDQLPEGPREKLFGPYKRTQM